jgi:hypothetical protein
MLQTLLPRLVSWVLLALGAATAFAGCPPPPPKPPVLDAACRGALVASTPGTVASAAVVELSGISASRVTDGVWWVHNDSGDSARVFAVGSDGRDLGEYALSAAAASDWEDIAVGPGPVGGVSYLYTGDIGDNAKARASIQVYRVREPAVNTAATTPPPQTLTDVGKLTFTYPDAPHDAEALLIDPSSGELFIVTKEFSGTSQVFRAPANLADGSTTTLTSVGTVSLGSGALVTAADVTPAGDVVALRTYSSVRLFPRAAGTPLAQSFTQPSCAGATASEPQGEAIGFTRDGRGYVTSSEGAHPALHRFVAP